jgi:hypothetical protein
MTAVRPLSRDHIVITLNNDFTCVTFRLNNGGAEAVILDPSGTECTRLAIAPPAPDQVLNIETFPDHIDILYEKKPHPVLDRGD